MKKIVQNTFLIVMGMVVMTGCLKTNSLYEGYTDIKPVADLPLSHLSSDTLTIYALPVAPSATATIDTVFAVHLSAKDHVGDVTFHLGLGTSDPAFLKFMAENPDYSLMPASLYSFDSTVVLKNAGVLTTANVPIKFKTGQVDANGDNLFLSNEYVLPIIIKDAGSYGIASNFRMIVMRVLAKNQYDGIYDLKIKTTGWAAYGIADGVSNDWGEIGIATAGATSVLFDYGAQVAFTDAGGRTAFGATNPQFTFDPATNKLTSVINVAPPDSRNRTFTIDPAVTDSRYDPDSKIIYAAYIMNQNGRPPQYIRDTLTYLRER
jgi:Domain of unknown function (DUF1735)